jgi:hypothetical protein
MTPICRYKIGVWKSQAHEFIEVDEIPFRDCVQLKSQQILRLEIFCIELIAISNSPLSLRRLMIFAPQKHLFPVCFLFTPCPVQRGQLNSNKLFRLLTPSQSRVPPRALESSPLEPWGDHLMKR